MQKTWTTTVSRQMMGATIFLGKNKVYIFGYGIQWIGIQTPLDMERFGSFISKSNNYNRLVYWA